MRSNYIKDDPEIKVHRDYIQYIGKAESNSQTNNGYEFPSADTRKATILQSTKSTKKMLKKKKKCRWKKTKMKKKRLKKNFFSKKNPKNSQPLFKIERNEINPIKKGKDNDGVQKDVLTMDKNLEILNLKNEAQQ